APSERAPLLPAIRRRGAALAGPRPRQRAARADPRALRPRIPACLPGGVHGAQPRAVRTARLRRHGGVQARPLGAATMAHVARAPRAAAAMGPRAGLGA